VNEIETTNERPRISLGKRIGLALAVLLVLLLVLGLVMQPLGGPGAALRNATAELDESDPDWRLEDLERTREEVSEEENSARVVVRTFDLLPRDWGKTVEALDGKVRQPERPAPVQLNDEQGALLKAALKRVAPALAEARKLAGLPRGRHRLTIAFNPIATLLPDVQRARDSASLLQFDALLRAHEKDFDGALLSCRGILNAGRSVGDEPFAISQLVRCACVVVACNTTQRVLAQGEASEAALSELEKLLADEDRHPTLWIGLRGERAMYHDLFTKLEDGSITMRSIIDEFKMAGLPPDAGLRVRLFGFSKGELRRQHLQMLLAMNRAVAMTRLGAQEQPAEEAAVDREIKAVVSNNFLLRIFMSGPNSILDAFRRKQALVRSLRVLLAAERYRMKNGAWPEKIEQLKPAWLEAVPADPYDDRPIRYRRLGDGVVAYAIGKDRKDDGGQIDRPASGLPLDVGHQLWDVKARRQPPGGK
jgi:hypothetical protein